MSKFYEIKYEAGFCPMVQIFNVNANSPEQAVRWMKNQSPCPSDIEIKSITEVSRGREIFADATNA